MSTGEPNDQPTRQIVDNARDELERINDHSWTHQNEHTVAAESWGRWRDVLGLPIAVLSGITSAAAFSQLPDSGIVAGFLALVVTGLTATATYLNPSQKNERHRAFAASFQSLRYEIDRFEDFVLPRASDEDLIQTVEKLMTKFEDLSKTRPEISGGESVRARVRMEKMHDSAPKNDENSRQKFSTGSGAASAP